MKFELIAGNLALDFTNTHHHYGSGGRQDDLKSYSDLIVWGRQARLLRDTEVRRLLEASPASATRDFRRAIALRSVLYDVFSSIAVAGKAGSQALGRLNTELRRALAGASLQRSGSNYELGWGKHKPIERMRCELIHAAMGLLTSGEPGRLRQCEGDVCTWLFVDTSRNGKRRWCDMRHCGNRAKVRRFRQRGAAARDSTTGRDSPA